MVGTLVPGLVCHQVGWHCPPLDIRTDDDPPAWKAARAVASATSPDVATVSSAPTFMLPLMPAHSRLDRSATRDKSLPAETSTGVSVAQYSAPPAPVVGRFHQTGGDRPCQCCCRYHVSLNKISLWIRILHSCTWWRPSCTQRHQGPGCRHLALIWQNLTQRLLVLLCPVLQYLTLCQWCLKTCSPIRAGLCHSAPRVHRCLQRLWTRGFWSRRSLTLLSCLRICQL